MEPDVVSQRLASDTGRARIYERTLGDGSVDYLASSQNVKQRSLMSLDEARAYLAKGAKGVHAASRTEDLVCPECQGDGGIQESMVYDPFDDSWSCLNCGYVLETSPEMVEEDLPELTRPPRGEALLLAGRQSATREWHSSSEGDYLWDYGLDRTAYVQQFADGEWGVYIYAGIVDDDSDVTNPIRADRATSLQEARAVAEAPLPRGREATAGEACQTCSGPLKTKPEKLLMECRDCTKNRVQKRSKTAVPSEPQESDCLDCRRGDHDKCNPSFRPFCGCGVAGHPEGGTPGQPPIRGAKRVLVADEEVARGASGRGRLATEYPEQVQSGDEADYDAWMQHLADETMWGADGCRNHHGGLQGDAASEEEAKAAAEAAVGRRASRSREGSLNNDGFADTCHCGKPIEFWSKVGWVHSDGAAFCEDGEKAVPASMWGGSQFTAAGSSDLRDRHEAGAGA